MTIGPTILEVDSLQKWFPIRRGLLRRVVGHVRAVDDVSFDIQKGETLSLVGEFGLRQDHDLALHPARAHADRGRHPLPHRGRPPGRRGEDPQEPSCGRCGARCR